jgi:DNA-binding NarL/FixJ family response regulator
MQKVLLSDDHSIIRRGLKYLFATHFTKYALDEVHSITDTCKYLKNNTPKFAIFDLQLSDGNITDIMPAITARYPQLDILIYSMSREDIYAKRLLQLGAKGFLNKDADEEEVIRALRIFLAGENYISQGVNSLLLNDLRNNKNKNLPNPFSCLSNREVEVTHQLLSGKSIKLIGEQMNLHPNTVITYKNRVLEKLSVYNILELNNLARLYQFI